MQCAGCCMAVCLLAMVAGAAPRGRAPRVTASSVERDDPQFAAENVLDQRGNTRWSSDFADRQWLMLDFGEPRDLVGLDVQWEAARAKTYDVLLSADGEQWRTVRRVSDGEGTVDDLYFGRRRARYIKLDLLERASPWGYSIWEVRVKGLDEEIGAAASSERREGAAALVIDGDVDTEWHSDGGGEQRITLDFGRPRSLGGAVIVWGKDHAPAYRVEVSGDGNDWRTADEETGGTGGRDARTFNVWDARYLRLTCTGGDTQGYGVREIQLVDWKEAARRSSLDITRGLAGVESSPFKIHTGRDGTFAPEPHAFQVSFWIHDRSAGQLYTPETLETAWSLEEGRLPINVVSWRRGDLEVTTRVFSRRPDEQGPLVTFARTEVRNASAAAKEVDGYVVVRPSVLARAKGNRDVREIACDGRGLVTVDGRPGLIVRSTGATQPPGPAIEWAGVVPLTAAGTVSAGEEGARAAVVCPARIEPGELAVFDVTVPSSEGEVDTGRLAGLDYDEQLEAVRACWRGRVPMKVRVPDRAYADGFYSSLHYMLLLKSGPELWPGPYNYRGIFLHDAVDMVEALDKAGLTDIGRECLAGLEYREGDGYLDGIGGCVYALVAHYLLTRDEKWLKEAYPRIVRHARLLQSLRAKQLTEEFKDSDAHGLLPPSVSQDNFTRPAHLYVDAWWALVGFKAGARAARALGRDEDAQWMEAEYAGLREDILASLSRVMKRDGMSRIPAFADNWPPEERVVDLERRILCATQEAWAHRAPLTPGGGLGIQVPKDLFRAAYEAYWEDAGRFSGYDGGWYVECETFFWGYNVLLARPLVFLGMCDVALKSIEWSLRNPSCPGGWCEAMKSRVNAQGLREVAPGIVGDVPHGWTAGHYALLFRDMLLHEEGDRLVLLACVPERWFRPGQHIEVEGAETFFGTFGMKIESGEKEIRVSLDIAEGPSGGFLLSVPGAADARKILVNGQPGGEIRDGAIALPPDAREVVVARP